MRIEIPYGLKKIGVIIRDENFGEMVYPNRVTVGDETKTLKEALARPIASKSFDDFLEDAKNVLFIVNDGTRPTPTAKVLDVIHDKIASRNVQFIVATGVHRAPTEMELREIFGNHLETYRNRIHIHDAKKDEDMVFLGISKYGTEIWINRLGAEAHKIAIIGSVEPHYFAGYTGGRKAILPGIAAYKTIEQNHRLVQEPGARVLVLEGNPVHEDMDDAIRSITDKEIFSIMTVLDRENRIYAATAGDVTESFKAAVAKSHDVFSVEIQEKADIVVAVVSYPMDSDLYQSQKALHNARLALNPNGILILVSKCRSGVGLDTFVKLLSSAQNPQDFLNRIEKPYVLGYHQAAKIAEILCWAEIWAVSDIDSEVMKSIFIRSFDTIQNALDAAVQKKGSKKILFLMAASLTIPRLREASFLSSQDAG